MISKSLSTSERRARLHDVAGRLAEFCQAVYPLMVVHTDDFGRHAGDPFTVKHVIDPTSRRTLDEFARALQHLDEVGLIQWYDVNGRKFYQVIDFDLHQTGLHKRTKSLIPEPPGISRKPMEVPSELKRTEQKGTELVVVPRSNISDARAPDGSLWEQITEKLSLKEANRRNWFEPCSVHRITDGHLEINTITTTRAQFLNDNFRKRITSECADILGARQVVFVVKPMSVRVG